MKSIYNYLIESSFRDKYNSIINSQDFKTWFLGSKIVDTDGNPIVLYHGSPDNKIKKLNPSFDGLWLTDNIKVSNKYSNNDSLEDVKISTKLIKIFKKHELTNTIEPILRDLIDIGYNVDKISKSNGSYYPKWYYQITNKNGETKDIYEYARPTALKQLLIPTGKNYAMFANIKNPLIVDAKDSSWDSINFMGKLQTTKDIALYAKDNGYDGVVFKNLYEAGVKSTVYTIFNNNQIFMIN